MTEPERILREKIVPDCFFEEETRCEYAISSLMKKVWAVEIDLFFQFEKICKKHNIKYYADGGTVLGAIRHKGFIPWDDDMDFLMERKDYEKFISVAQTELKSPYFLQSPLTDVDYPLDILKIRNSNTSAITNNNLQAPRDNSNKGISISIFPIDNMPKSNIRRKYIQIYNRVLQVCNNAYSYNVNKNIITKTINKITHLPIFKKDFVQKNIKKMNKKNASEKNNLSGKYWIPNYSSWGCPRNIFDTSVFEEAIEVPFEFFTVKIPKGYEAFLKTVYGDYMEFPPVEERGNWHDMVFEPNVPYKEFFEKLKSKTNE